MHNVIVTLLRVHSLFCNKDNPTYEYTIKQSAGKKTRKRENEAQARNETRGSTADERQGRQVESDAFKPR